MLMKTKWATHHFTKPEREAQKVWRRADKQLSEIVQALKSCDHYMSREDMHKRLDRRLDSIERMQTKAQGMFPDVRDSFTMATMSL